MIFSEFDRNVIFLDYFEIEILISFAIHHFNQNLFARNMARFDEIRAIFTEFLIQIVALEMI